MKGLLAVLLGRTRRNHALEHATMHLLSQSHSSPRLVGRSDWRGFWLYGSVSTERVLAATTQALSRLRGHESQLAIHPRCGTRLTMTFLSAGTLAYAIWSLPTRSRWTRGLAVAASLLGTLLASRSLGDWAQRELTTCADLGHSHVSSIERMRRSPPGSGDETNRLVVHRVLIAHEEM